MAAAAAAEAEAPVAVAVVAAEGVAADATPRNALDAAMAAAVAADTFGRVKVVAHSLPFGLAAGVVAGVTGGAASAGLLRVLLPPAAATCGGGGGGGRSVSMSAMLSKFTLSRGMVSVCVRARGSPVVRRSAAVAVFSLADPAWSANANATAWGAEAQCRALLRRVDRK
jgi:hypothetical protein